MQIVYTGVSDAVEVPYSEDGVLRMFNAVHGVPAECPDELAAMLLEQADIWAKAGARGGKPGKPEPATTNTAGSD